MVRPLAREADWVPYLASVPQWNPPLAATLVVVPHPDDETLAAGGLIAALRAKGADVTVVAVTDGEHAYADNHGLAALRRSEQTCALARLGVEENRILRLGLVDSSVADQQELLTAKLRSFIRPETQVLAPWIGDFHPDHEACARAAGSVASEVGATLISYFFWTWHRGTPPTLHGLHLRRFALTEEIQLVKADALACHASQLDHAPEPAILPENLLWPARMSFEVFAL